MGLLAVPALAAANIRPLTGYAWSSNIGWIKFDGDNYGVSLDTENGYFSGYAWSSNIGWVRFGEHSGRLGDSYPGEPRHGARWDAAVNRIKGWARVCSAAADGDKCRGGVSDSAGDWDGWIKFSGDGYNVHLTKNRCVLRGWAWGSEVLGWIRFPSQGVYFKDCSERQIPEEDEEEPVVPPKEERLQPIAAPVCAFTAAPSTVAKSGRATLRWDCGATADSCSVTAAGVVNGPPAGAVQTQPLARTTTFILTCNNSGASANFTAAVKVVRPAYCEVIPFIGKCK